METTMNDKLTETIERLPDGGHLVYHSVSKAVTEYVAVDELKSAFAELERLRAMESAVREIYPNRHEMFDTEDDSASIRFHRRIMELGKFMSQQCFDEYKVRQAANIPTNGVESL